MIPSESIEYMRRVCSNMRRHHAPFWGTRESKVVNREQGDDYICAQGTLTFIQFKGKCYGITCDHVIQNNISIIGEEDTVWYVGTLTADRVVPKESIIYRGESKIDLAIIEFPCKLLKKNNKIPLHLSKNFYKPAVGKETLLACGYPGKYRHPTPNNQNQRTHELSRNLLTCHHQNERIYMLEDDLTQSSILGGLNENGIKKVYMGGISGGGLYRLLPKKYELIGITKGAESNLDQHNNLQDITNLKIHAIPLYNNKFEKLLSLPNSQTI